MNPAMMHQSGALKISAFIDPTAGEDDLKFLEQLGVRYVYTWLSDEHLTPVFLDALVRRVRRYGLTLYNAGNLTLGKSAAIHLGLPEREAHIERFIGMLKLLGEAGIHTTTITWEPNGTLSTSPDGRVLLTPEGMARGGAKARMIDMRVMNAMPETHGRAYAKAEIWDNFAYFARRVTPFAEQYRVRIALHPNDPPVDQVAGIATLIQSAEDYRRALDIASSDFFGMEFCCGCWLEGGEAFGNLLGDFREFAGRDKVFIVHFRNVSNPLPCFTETFLDDGYGDMPAVMKAISETGYGGTVTLDHSPSLTPTGGDIKGAERAATAYALGYLKALVQAFGQ